VNTFPKNHGVPQADQFADIAKRLKEIEAEKLGQTIPEPETAMDKVKQHYMTP